MTSNAVPPAVVPPSPNEWPQGLVTIITGITQAMQAQVTCPSHGFTSTDQNTTFIMFKQVQGMIQINGQNALIQKVIDTNNFTVNINSTNFYAYTGAGVVIVDSGEPPIEKQSFQFFNTPFQNVANIP